MHVEATRQTSAFNFSAAVTTQGAAASSQGNSITPAWGALTSWRKNYTFGQAEKAALERASQSVVPASVQEGVLEENFLSPVVSPLLSLSSSGGGREGGGGVHFGVSQSVGSWWDPVFCAQSAEVIITWAQTILIGCVPKRMQNYIPLGQCSSWSARDF